MLKKNKKISLKCGLTVQVISLVQMTPPWLLETVRVTELMISINLLSWNIRQTWRWCWSHVLIGKDFTVVVYAKLCLLDSKRCGPLKPCLIHGRFMLILLVLWIKTFISYSPHWSTMNEFSCGCSKKISIWYELGVRAIHDPIQVKKPSQIKSCNFLRILFGSNWKLIRFGQNYTLVKLKVIISLLIIYYVIREILIEKSLASQPSWSLKDDFENWMICCASSFVSHGTRFEMSHPRPLQLTSALVKLLVEKQKIEIRVNIKKIMQIRKSSDKYVTWYTTVEYETTGITGKLLGSSCYINPPVVTFLEHFCVNHKIYFTTEK